jgi:AcrR family transcriptional regulator
MTTVPPGEPAWADRAAARSPIVQRSRDRSVQQAKQIVNAAIELSIEKGTAFTIQELATRAKVALQTFYRHFAGKDELLLAVIEQTISESMVGFAASASHLTDPLERLHHYISVVMQSVLDDPSLAAQRRFMTAEHYRLHQVFPDELAAANRAFTDLLIPDIRAATEAGQLAPNDIDADAWYVTQLVMATYHHYSYASTDRSPTEIVDSLWRFCVAALGGDATTKPRRRPKRAKT